MGRVRGTAICGGIRVRCGMIPAFSPSKYMTAQQGILKVMTFLNDIAEITLIMVLQRYGVPGLNSWIPEGRYVGRDQKLTIVVRISWRLEICIMSFVRCEVVEGVRGKGSLIVVKGDI